LKLLTETGGKVKEISLPIGKEEFKVTVNPALHLFIGASNETIKDTALVGSSGRFKSLQFMPYSDAGKRVLFHLMSPTYARGIEFPESVLEIMVRNVRPFARSIKSLLQSIRARAVHGQDVITDNGIKAALVASGYRPGGWTEKHLKVLLFIDKAPRQVMEISAGPLQGASQGDTQSILAELMQGMLVRTENGKKIITSEGQTYLKNLKKGGK
jgi:hypothetical protein